MGKKGSFKNLLNGLLRLRNYFLVPEFTWAEFSSPSTLHLGPFITLLSEPLLETNNLSQIKLGLHEALVNAVRHGNSGDSAKSLRVRRIITPKWFVWQIQDEGNGLPSSSRIASLPSNVDSESGRGLFLINECFDDVRWSLKGNRLQLACRR